METYPAFISRDPFARSTLVRRVVHTKKTCDWCGQNDRGRLFVYADKPDSGRVREHRGEFCCKGCHDSYNS